MTDISETTLDLDNLKAAGWLRFLPAIAAHIFDQFSLLAAFDPLDGSDEEAMVVGGVISRAGFEEIYDPAQGAPSENIDLALFIWREWQAHAASAGLQMATVGDIVDFMTVLGLLETYQSEGRDHWRLPASIPLPEEVLTLTSERLKCERVLRRQHELLPLQLDLMRWLLTQRTAERILCVPATISSLARVLGCDPDELRDALAALWGSGLNVSVSADPALIGYEEEFTITVYWGRFACLHH
jgi:hypothetical protein